MSQKNAIDCNKVVYLILQSNSLTCQGHENVTKKPKKHAKKQLPNVNKLKWLLVHVKGQQLFYFIYTRMFRTLMRS
jgi:hypothetical protein